MSGAAESGRVTFVGHATVLLELGGRRLLTDPLLAPRVAHLARQGRPPAAAASGQLDAVLLSHAHHDHLHGASLRRISRDVPVIAARGAGRYARRLGFAEVTELAPGEATDVGGVAVAATPAEHDGRRFGRGRHAESVGFALGAGEERVYFAGDTDLFAGMAELAPLDLALLPVWGWGPRLGPGHLDPDRAAEALRLLQPRIAVPIHWGTYFPAGLARPLRHRLERPPLDFAARAAELAPEVRVEILQPGESLALPLPEPA